VSDIVYLNGDFVPRDEARVSVDDRGFLFGDGVYEMTPAYGGRFFRLDRHLKRLQFGLSELSIAFDLAPVEKLHDQLLEKNGLTDAELSAVYLQVTRGEAPRAHHFPPAGTPATAYAFAKGFQRPSATDWEKGAAAITVPDRRWGRVDVKTLQLLPNAMAQQAARAAGVSDAILVREGMALEGALNNLFVVFGESVRTHPRSNQILPGITREALIEIAREEGIEVEERITPVEALREASEVFLTGTTTEVRPIVRIDDRPVGTGSVGPVTSALSRAFLARVAEECGVGSGATA
jgi:D-alanine transaminase